MCNLYSNLTTQEAMRRVFPERVEDHLGNLEPQPAIYPNQLAPILRHASAGLALVPARWGLPTPPRYLAGKGYDRGVTNIRNTDSPHWRRWLAPAHRCLVPFTRFAEPAPGGNVWFAPTDPDAPVFFAGLQVPGWRSVRKVKDGETVDDLFAFLTCAPNDVVAPIHPKAMPVILTDPAEWRTWLDAPWAEARTLQRPLGPGLLTIAR